MFLLMLALIASHSPGDTIRSSLERNHVPGAVIAIVRRGQPPSVSGYGLANVAARIPVDPERTAFRTASVSKVITAAMVSQLIEQGRLDPHADVNRYLDFAIPPFDGKSITLANLLTHTAGFDDRYAGKSARTFGDAPPLGAYLKRARPARIVPPGQVVIYSNYGIALAGYAAERATGKPFAQLAQDAVFQPLGMVHSSFLLPQPAATPYEWTGSAWRALSWDYLQDAPAGMQMSSGADLARFIEWALEHSSRPEFQPQFTHRPRLEGALGWAWELGHARGHAFAGHDGGYPGVVARVRLFPREGVGYAIMANALNGAFLAEASDVVEQQLVTGFGPVPRAKPVHWDSNVRSFSGVYRDVRYSHDTLIKTGVLLGLLGGELTIGATPDGFLTMPKLDGSPRRMAQIEPNLFQSLDDDYLCAFRRDSSGAVTHLFTNGTFAMERVPWLLTVPVQRRLFLLCALTLVLLMIGPTRRWLLPDTVRTPASWTANAFGFQMLCLGISLQLLPSAVERSGSYLYGFPWPIWIAQTLGLSGVACLGWFLLRLSRTRPFRPAPWLVFSVLVTYTAWLWQWRLLGYRF